MKYLIAFFKTIWQLLKGFYRYQKKVYTVNNLFHRENIFAIVCVAFLGFSVFAIFERFEEFNPLGKALSDVDMTDIYFSKFGKNDEYRETKNGVKELDEDVVLVNIGELSRYEIGVLLHHVNSYKPKVVGIDAFFRKRGEPRYMPFDYIQTFLSEKAFFTEVAKDSLLFTQVHQAMICDSVLAEAMSNTKNLVLVCEGDGYYNEEKNVYDSISTSNKFFTQFGTQGIANLPTDVEGNMKVCRKFMTGAKLASKDMRYQESFMSEIVKIYDPEAYKRLKKRGNDEEYINYLGYMYVPFDSVRSSKGYFRAFDCKDILNDMNRIFLDSILTASIKDKIVLMGYLGKDFDDRSGEDKFYTPLNDKFVGKARRDMYGVVIHANAIAMMLKGIYINETPSWLGHVIGFLLVYWVFASFRPMLSDHRVWYDAVSKIIGFIVLMIVFFVIGEFFYKYDYRIAIPGMYFVLIPFASDGMEIYHGLLKNFIQRVKSNL